MLQPRQLWCVSQSPTEGQRQSGVPPWLLAGTGLVAVPIVLWSEYALKTTGQCIFSHMCVRIICATKRACHADTALLRHMRKLRLLSAYEMLLSTLSMHIWLTA